MLAYSYYQVDGKAKINKPETYEGITHFNC
jgi:hypothetical protein